MTATHNAASASATLHSASADRHATAETTAAAPLSAELTPGAAVLLPAARAARDELHQAGDPLTRDALATHLRQQGYQIRNDRITSLLSHLRHEQPQPLAPAGPQSAASRLQDKNAA